jgi:hypothetical protein
MAMVVPVKSGGGGVVAVVVVRHRFVMVGIDREVDDRPHDRRPWGQHRRERQRAGK